MLKAERGLVITSFVSFAFYMLYYANNVRKAEFTPTKASGYSATRSICSALLDILKSHCVRTPSFSFSDWPL